MVLKNSVLNKGEKRDRRQTVWRCVSREARNRRSINTDRQQVKLYFSHVRSRYLIIYIPDPGPRGVSGLVPNISPLIEKKKEKNVYNNNNNITKKYINGCCKRRKRINNWQSMKTIRSVHSLLTTKEV